MIRPRFRPTRSGPGRRTPGEELIAQCHREDSEPADAELASDLAEAAEEEDD